jgi:hypothetical protein
MKGRRGELQEVAVASQRLVDKFLQQQIHDTATEELLGVFYEVHADVI